MGRRAGAFAHHAGLDADDGCGTRALSHELGRGADPRGHQPRRDLCAVAGDLLGASALAADGGPDPDPTLGFEFRLYKDARTQGQYTGAWGAEDYSVQDMRLDVIPVRMHRPLYEALPENEKKER